MVEDIESVSKRLLSEVTVESAERDEVNVALDDIVS